MLSQKAKSPIVWKQDDDQLHLILLRTWVADILTQICAQLLDGGRIEHAVHVKQ